MSDNQNTKEEHHYTYPVATKGDVTDTYHGQTVADPYRWLEDPDSPETKAWVKEENLLTRQYLDEFKGRGSTKDRLRELWDYSRYSLPHKHGSSYFYSRIDGLQNQPVVYRQTSLDGEPVLVLDPNNEFFRYLNQSCGEQ